MDIAGGIGCPGAGESDDFAPFVTLAGELWDSRPGQIRFACVRAGAGMDPSVVIDVLALRLQAQEATHSARAEDAARTKLAVRLARLSPWFIRALREELAALVAREAPTPQTTIEYEGAPEVAFVRSRGRMRLRIGAAMRVATTLLRMAP